MPLLCASFEYANTVPLSNPHEVKNDSQSGMEIESVEEDDEEEDEFDEEASETEVAAEEAEDVEAV